MDSPGLAERVMARHISLYVKVFSSDGKASQVFNLHVERYEDVQAHANQHEVACFIEQLKAEYPGNEFKVVPMGRNRWNVFPQPLANA
jgi:hypothetical protein